MKPADFLKLIGAPWAAYHDHPNPDTASYFADIRSLDSPRHYNDVCQIGGCDNQDDYVYSSGKRQRASRDLIVQAPRMYQYIAKMAETGDTEAKMILREIHREQ